MKHHNRLIVWPIHPPFISSPMLGFDHPRTHGPSALTDMETEDQLASLIPVLFAIRLVTVRFSSSVA